MAWGNSLLNTAADAAATECNWVACLIDAGVRPETTRAAVTWAAADAGSVSASNQPVFDIVAGEFVYSVVLYDGEADETYQASYALPVSVEFTEAGTYTLTGMTLSVSNPA